MRIFRAMRVIINKYLTTHVLLLGGEVLPWVFGG